MKFHPQIGLIPEDEDEKTSEDAGKGIAIPPSRSVVSNQSSDSELPPAVPQPSPVPETPSRTVQEPLQSTEKPQNGLTPRRALAALLRALAKRLDD